MKNFETEYEKLLKQLKKEGKVRKLSVKESDEILKEIFGEKFYNPINQM